MERSRLTAPSPMDMAPKLRVYAPSPPLSHFVEIFWYWEGANPPKIKERILPTGTVEFVIRLTQNSIRVYDSETASQCLSLSGAVVTGVQSRPFVLNKGDQDLLLGVHFKPGGAFPFFGVPADELKNHHLSLDSLWGSDAERFRSALLEAPSIKAKFVTLEKWLMRVANGHAFKRHPAVSFLLAELGQSGVQFNLSELADRAGFSQRRLIQVFKNEVGLTPKIYSRICRFQGVIQTLERKAAALTDVSWLDIALEGGYFDQAHFIHEFQEFSGFRPTDYFHRRTSQLNHVPL